MKHVVITGAAGGIGRCLVDCYADAGYQVSATDVTLTDFPQPTVHFTPLHILDVQQLETFWQTAISQFGRS